MSSSEDTIPRYFLFVYKNKKKGEKITWKEESSLPYLKEARENVQGNLVSSKVQEVFLWRYNNTPLHREYYLCYILPQYHIFKAYRNN